MKFKFFPLLAFLGLLAAPVRADTAVTATLAADSNYLLPAGGTATLTVTISGYAVTTSSLGVTLALPSGWAYASATGGPEVKPVAGDTGTLGWAYTTIPASPASFSFAVTYPASAGTPSLAAAVIVRDSGTRTDLNSTTVNFLQATLPVVTNTDPATATYGSAVSFDISATSPITITGYDATGLPAGLSVNSSSGHVSGTPTVTGGPFTITLKATNAVGTGTKDVALTINKATASVALSNLNQTYSGGPRPVTVTTTPSGLAVVVLYAGSSSPPVNTGSYAVTATIDDANHTGSGSGTLMINQAAQTISFAAIGTVNPGQSVTLSASASSGLPVTFSVVSGSATVNGATLSVTGSGDIVVRASQAGDSNYLPATADRAVNSEKLVQTLTFTLPASMDAGQTITLSATASSGLPVSFSVVSGPATLAGTQLTATGGGALVVRAAQAGNDLYLATSLDLTLNVQKLEQTITFASLPDKVSSDGPITLTATASSGLPVTFAVVSGPALLAGNTLTLTGVAGDVFVRASQAGDNRYLPAPDVTRSFTVSAADDRTFTGRGSHKPASVPGRVSARDVTPSGDVAAVLPANSTMGSLLIVAPEVGINELVGFTLNIDGSFALMATQTTAEGTQTVNGTGLLNGTTLTGSFDSIGFSFSAMLDPAGGPSANSQGLYISTALGTNSGFTYTIIGTNNDVLVLIVTPTGTVGGPATLADNNTFTVQSGNVAIAGSLNPGTTSVSTSLTTTDDQGGSTTIGFGGLKTTTTRTDRLINLSGRAHVGTGEKVLISGFVIGGASPKPVLIRAVGPGLAPLGVAAPLANPRIRIVRGDGVVVAQNEDWGDNADAAAIATTSARVGAFALTPGSADAAFLTTLQPGLYTAVVSGGDGTALAEIYDASENPDADYQRLVNISARGYVGTGDDVLIGGLVISGNSPKRVLIRAVGPTLTTQGITAPLADPTLKVFKGGTVIGFNDNWDADPVSAAALTDAATKTGAFALTPGSKDAAIIMTLAPGVYTMHVSPAAGTAPGIALAEIYEVPE